MYHDLKEEEVVKLVGGRFKLSTLIQKRLVQLNAGSQPLVHTTATDNMEIALQEILQGKIKLNVADEVEIVSLAEGLDLDPSDL